MLMKTIDELTYLVPLPHRGTLQNNFSFKLNPYTVKALIDIKLMYRRQAALAS